MYQARIGGPRPPPYFCGPCLPAARRLAGGEPIYTLLGRPLPGQAPTWAPPLAAQAAPLCTLNGTNENDTYGKYSSPSSSLTSAILSP
jgi:hypothetical protein